MQTTDPSLHQAAVMTHHWSSGDVEAAIFLVTEITDVAELQDLVMALLIMRDKPLEEIRNVVTTTVPG
jgi:hypothetical protein